MDGDAMRHDVYVQSGERLSHMATKHIIEKKINPIDLVGLCISVDDPSWRHLVDHLMPGHDWQSIRDRGEDPMAVGVVERKGVSEMFRSSDREDVVQVADVLDGGAPPGHVFVLILGWDGFSLYDVPFAMTMAGGTDC